MADVTTRSSGIPTRRAPLPDTSRGERSASTAQHPLRTRALAGATEVAVVGALLCGYLVARAAAQPDDPGAAVERTLSLVRLERALSVFREVDVQRMVIGRQALVEVANAIYLFGMHPVLLAVASWLYARDPRHFRFIAAVMLVSGAIRVAGYYLWPAAPPRLLAGFGHDLGFVDTLHAPQATLRDRQPAFLVNDYAAIPSYHFAWMLLPAIALWIHTRSRMARAATVAVLASMCWAVVVTGNHLFTDLVLGIVALAVAWLAVEALARPWPRLLSAPAAVRRSAVVRPTSDREPREEVR